jgi:hypothetical protein
MSSFKVNINLQAEFSSQELADFFTALAKSERGDVEPLMRILHPIEPPPVVNVSPPNTPAPVEQVDEHIVLATAPAPATVPAPAPAPAPARNTQWQRTSITLVDDATVEARTQAIVTGEFLSPASSISWLGVKHNPRSLHNQRILAVLRAAPNRTMSFTSVGAQAGIPEREKLTGYLREMEKQGLITTARILY